MRDRRLKDRSFGAAFWNQIKSIQSKNARGTEIRWKTDAQLEAIFGFEKETMKETLPWRKHPRNARVRSLRSTLNFKPSTMNIKPYTLNPKHINPNPTP